MDYDGEYVPSRERVSGTIYTCGEIYHTAASAECLADEYRQAAEDYQYAVDHNLSKKEELLDILNSGEADYITFASSSTVTNFVDIIGKENIDKLNELKVISIGPITTQTAKSLNINVYKEAEVSTIDGMIDSIMNDK